MYDYLCSKKSKTILSKGESVCYDWYRIFPAPTGARWVARYKGQYYLIIFDGTGNQFFHSHDPKPISEKYAKYLLWKSDEYEKGMEKFGWAALDDELEAEFLNS